ncbi:hypothetical protein M0R72_22035 [Candidatus Pacearchaeota archaeon]|jgi:hypothetical protein|nr:hypothetical protein [Candidatus Pacearchaeota archaeon]
MITSRDAYPVQSFYASARTAAADGDATVDLKGYEGALICISSGTITDGTAWVFELKESANNSTFTAVADGDLVAGGPTAGDLEPTFTDADSDNEDHWFYYRGNKRYLRIDLTAVTGSPGTGGIFSGIVVKLNAHHLPTV